MEKLTNIPILMYHNILNKNEMKCKNNFCIEPSIFISHMDYLVKNGFSSINFEDLDMILSGRAIAPEKPVIITFDDAYAQTVENVVPLLYSKNIKGVFSVVTNYIGKESAWEKDNPPYLTISKKQLKAYSKELISFESHTKEHLHLSQLTDKKLDSEMRDSKAVLEAITGRRVRAVFYPYGSYNHAVKVSAARAGYRFGLAVSTRKRTVTGDLLEMRRIFIKASDSLASFKRKVSPWYLWFRGLREARRNAGIK